MVFTLPGTDAVLVALAAVPGHVPAYSRSEVWIGTGILLCLLVGLLIVLVRSTKVGPRLLRGTKVGPRLLRSTKVGPRHAFGRGRRISPSSRGRRRILRRPGRR
ncbi:hypothetical protein [Nocardia terpenica]|uniref:Uncharacterized protein n=1 Tax=Nocardia terpenica TaxID=455432 RepID=A0A161Z2K0_9NOCA|nr:hypothetical protein [Nocardia terpenica]KZM72594.1 hypothetical protein AWN90_27750 [Nocardia terpenica]NQE92521.1 hypothetical protein [Nocardia terpenica]